MTAAFFEALCDRPVWMESAACRGLDPEFFFPGKGAPAGPIRAVCSACPVTDECLDYALDHRERSGVWGGTSERERRRIVRQRKAAAA